MQRTLHFFDLMHSSSTAEFLPQQLEQCLHVFVLSSSKCLHGQSLHSVFFSAVQELMTFLDPQSLHTLQEALSTSSEYVPGVHGTQSPAAFIANVIPHGGEGSSPTGHKGQEKHLTLLLASSRIVYVSGGHWVRPSG